MELKILTYGLLIMTNAPNSLMHSSETLIVSIERFCANKLI